METPATGDTENQVAADNVVKKAATGAAGKKAPVRKDWLSDYYLDTL